MYIQYEATQVKDYLVVLSCSHCCDLGHTVKFCMAQDIKYSHSGKDGHKKVECLYNKKDSVCDTLHNEKKETCRYATIWLRNI